MRGRKPTPTHLKLLEGNPGKRAINKSEPKPTGNLFEAPGWLTDSQKDGWAYAIANAPAGLMKRLDRAMLTMWVVAEDLHRDAAIKVAKSGSVVRTKYGQETQSPYLSILNRQAVVMVKLASEMGFSPASRTRIQMEVGEPNGESKPGSPFAQFKR